MSRVTSSSSEFGPATRTSAASTGSVGASTAPSSTAAAGASPSRVHPRKATDAMHSGMVTASSLQVGLQERSPGRRSIDSPAPMSATITATSVRRSMSSRLSSGRKPGRGSGNSPATAPVATNAIAVETAGKRSSGMTPARNSPVPATR